ncbi:cytochrome ubiquinol oxidase subunit I [Methylomonas methanica]|uniref:Cytochrome bd ubiquinol oxidase subunit I n=1 Tax=Methylomonas methanica (strain DSM 25384 / MC09) TaxID=857087 RepID=G0A261_METMM|nr:cytochrome ubiquinol oxidase subunit I [Methylomonas methanica]AEG02604.1 cytochrome bd ubiquinol oxidase subunit I [Methylomonas methanica MC09]
MISETVIELSRWQFAITAMLHFLFIPLTLGLAVFLALLESTYAVTGQPVYKTMARFWGKIFTINFVLAVATRIVVVFQFGMTGSYFSHYVGDIFALPLAIEAFTGFFLAAVLFGPYWFGLEKMGQKQHLLLTWLMALALNVSAFWVLLANGWTQNPVAASFNYQSYRMELTDLGLLIANPAALAKYVHTVAACYVTAMATIMGISGYWLRKQPQDPIALRSFNWAAAIGVVMLGVTVGIGDATPDSEQLTQRAKLAAMQGRPVSSLLPEIETRIRSGITAYTLLQELRDDKKDPQLLAEFEEHKADLGYAMLLTPFHKTILDAQDKHISQAAQSALPAYPDLLCWGYRFMIAAGVLCLLWFILAGFYSLVANALPVWLVETSVYLAPIPWLACIAGWFVAEAGKQPWAIAGVLPTFMGISSLSVSELVVSALAYALAYSILLVVGLYLLRQTVLNRNVSQSGV